MILNPAQSMFRIIRPRNSEAVQLAWTQVWQENVPDLIRAFVDGDTDVFFCVLDVVEQAKLNSGSMFGKDGKIDAVSHPSRSQRIGQGMGRRGVDRAQTQPPV